MTSRRRAKRQVARWDRYMARYRHLSSYIRPHGLGAAWQRYRAPRGGHMVSHKPQWEPDQLPVNAAGDTRSGYSCTHQLENGNGQCGSNVFDVADSIGDHRCWVPHKHPHIKIISSG